MLHAKSALALAYGWPDRPGVYAICTRDSAPNLVTKCQRYSLALRKCQHKIRQSAREEAGQTDIRYNFSSVLNLKKKKEKTKPKTQFHHINQYALLCKHVCACPLHIRYIHTYICICIHNIRVRLYIGQIKWHQQARTILYLCKFISVTFPPFN